MWYDPLYQIQLSSSHLSNEYRINEWEVIKFNHNHLFNHKTLLTKPETINFKLQICIKRLWCLFDLFLPLFKPILLMYEGGNIDTGTTLIRNYRRCKTTKRYLYSKELIVYNVYHFMTHYSD